jgi:hypothetical protein
MGSGLRPDPTMFFGKEQKVLSAVNFINYGQALDLLVLVSSVHYWTYTPSLLPGHLPGVLLLILLSEQDILS